MAKKDLEKIIDMALKKAQKEENEERLKNAKEEAKIKKHQLFEKAHKKEKFKLYEDITKWSQRFMKTNLFKKISRLDIRCEIYGSGWGHKPDDNDDGCWSYVEINDDGLLEYTAGYKYVPSHENFVIDGSNVERLSFRYLQDFRNSIRTGEVYDYIKDFIGRWTI